MTSYFSSRTGRTSSSSIHAQSVEEDHRLLPALGSIGHAMVYVPELNLFVDGTASSMEIGNLPTKDMGAMAMTVDAMGNATRRTVPFTSPTDNSTPRDMEMAHVSDGGSVQAAEQAKITQVVAEGNAGSPLDGHLKIEALIAAAQPKP